MRLVLGLAAIAMLLKLLVAQATESNSPPEMDDLRELQRLVTRIEIGSHPKSANLAGIEAPVAVTSVSLEDCRQCVAAVQGGIPMPLEYVLHPPFAIMGNMPQEQLDGWYHRVIAPASTFFEQTFRPHLPTKPVRILLFPEEESYRTAVQSLLGMQHVSVFGFYHPRERTMLVNLEGGAGTLLHELTHAILGERCPHLPLWLHEGIASLYESGELRIHDHHVVLEPVFNWRQRLVEAHLAKGALPPLTDLMTNGRFVGEREALDYAMARTWCLYFSEHKLLPQLYVRMRDAGTSDPDGNISVRIVTGADSWEELDLAFSKWLHSTSSQRDDWTQQATRNLHYDP